MDAAYHLQGVGSVYPRGAGKSTTRLPEPYPSLADLILNMILVYEGDCFYVAVSR
jgi:hypothetical protein